MAAAALVALAALAAGGPLAAAPPPRDGDARLAPQRPGVTDAAIVSFGLFGGESVFESEAKGAAEVLAARLDGEGRTIVRSNTKRRGPATPEALAAAIRRAGAALDPDEDVLVVALTSHGAPQGLAVTAPGRRPRILSPAALEAMLDASGAHHRIVIVSACYSGVFARALADPRTLVITAAAADRPSFGCRDGATWTYFGEAFYDTALRRADGGGGLKAAFARAKDLVTARERREGFDPSNPQFAGGEEVLERLGRRD